MRLQRIYSSKIYVTSTRKDKIHAAMQDPINAELVQQIEDYLDDDAKQELAVAEAQNNPNAPTDQATPSGDGDFGAAPSMGGGSSGSAPSHSSLSGDIFQDFGDDELTDVEPMGDEDMPADEAEAPEVVESVTKEGEAITSTTIIPETVIDLTSEVQIIKGTLNAMEPTAGVSRIELKPEELWIYYEDKVNIGDIMVDVIETLNGANYTYLSFSRLARSNNAIVFDILMSATEPMKSVAEVKSED